MTEFDLAMQEFLAKGGVVETLEYRGPTESHRVIDGNTKGRFMRVTERPISEDREAYQTRMNDVIDNVLTSDD